MKDERKVCEGIIGFLYQSGISNSVWDEYKESAIYRSIPDEPTTKEQLEDLLIVQERFTQIGCELERKEWREKIKATINNIGSDGMLNTDADADTIGWLRSLLEDGK